MKQLVRTFRPLLAALLLASTTPVHAADAPTVLAKGAFEGRSGHAVAGTVTIVATGTGHRLLLQPDFRLDSAPDPRLALGRNGYVADTQFARLRRNSGRQAYELPGDIKPSDYTEVWLWCEAFSVPLGVAPLR